MELAKSDQLKDLDSIFVPDFRIYNWCELTRTEKPEYFHGELKKAELQRHVPVEIREQFEIARNVFLYSFYQYRIAMASQLYAFSVLEKSLKWKKKHSLYKDEKNSRGNGLKASFYYSMEKDWINDDAFGSQPIWPKRDFEDSHDICKRYISLYSMKRNELAHDPSSLDIPWDTLEVLVMTSQLINYLFKDLGDCS